MSAALELIVNADDFGLSEAVNRGIAAAHDDGIVTSTSLMATGAAFHQAVALARSRPKLAVGVHLVLTEQRPLLGPEGASLLRADGAFPAHISQLLPRILLRRVSLRDVHRELDAQIRRVRDAGIAVSHLDGHQHVHVLPGVARVVAELAAAHRIPAVRYPAERLHGYVLRGLPRARRIVEQVALRAFSAWSPLRGLRRSDDFVGFYYGGRLDEAALKSVLESLPRSGVVELMCHPGDEEVQSGADWRYEWTAERDALRSGNVRELIAARNVRLVAAGKLRES